MKRIFIITFLAVAMALSGHSSISVSSDREKLSSFYEPLVWEPPLDAHSFDNQAITSVQLVGNNLDSPFPCEDLGVQKEIVLVHFSPTEENPFWIIRLKGQPILTETTKVLSNGSILVQGMFLLPSGEIGHFFLSLNQNGSPYQFSIFSKKGSSHPDSIKSQNWEISIFSDNQWRHSFLEAELLVSDGGSSDTPAIDVDTTVDTSSGSGNSGNG